MARQAFFLLPCVRQPTADPSTRTRSTTVCSTSSPRNARFGSGDGRSRSPVPASALPVPESEGPSPGPTVRFRQDVLSQPRTQRLRLNHRRDVVRVDQPSRAPSTNWRTSLMSNVDRPAWEPRTTLDLGNRRYSRINKYTKAAYPERVHTRCITGPSPGRKKATRAFESWCGSTGRPNDHPGRR